MMIAHFRIFRSRLLRNGLNHGRTQNIRLRAPSSLPQASATLADRTPSIDNADHATVIAASGRDSIVVCWHPPKPFPYEHTKPIERTEEELRQGDSPLRPDMELEFKYNRAMFKKVPHYTELQNMYHTHFWSFKKRYREMRINETLEPPPIGRKGL